MGVSPVMETRPPQWRGCLFYRFGADHETVSLYVPGEKWQAHRSCLLL